MEKVSIKTDLNITKNYYYKGFYAKALQSSKDLELDEEAKTLCALIYIELLDFEQAQPLIKKNDFSTQFNLEFKSRNYISAFVKSQLLFAQRKNKFQERLGFFQNFNLASIPLLTFLANNAYEAALVLPCHPLYRGIINYGLNKYNKALSIFNDLKETFPVCNLFIAQIYEEMNDFSLAIDYYYHYYNQDLKAMSKDCLFLNLAVLWNKRGRDYTATHYLQKLLEKEDNPKYHFLLGKIYFNRNELHVALPSLLIANNAGYNANVELGDIYFSLAQYIEAVSHYIIAFNNKKDINIGIKLAKCHLMLANYRKLELYLNYIANEKRLKEIKEVNQLMEIASLLIRVRQYMRARKCYDLANSIKSIDEESFAGFIDTHLLLNGEIPEPTIKELNDSKVNIYNHKIMSAKKYYNNGYNILMNFNNKNKLIKVINNRCVYLELSFPDLITKDVFLLERAIECFSMAIKNYPGHILAYYYRALCNILLSNIHSALIDVNTIINHDSYASFQLFIIHGIVNDKETGVKKIRKYFDYYFYDKDYWLLLSIAYKQINDLRSEEYCLNRYNKLIGNNNYK